MLLVALLVQVLVYSRVTTAEDPPIVETENGKLRGKYMVSRSGIEFIAFTGVPYAKPPVGNLRFQAPEAVDSWEGIKDATTGGPMCTQNIGGIKGQEDCLYLSIFTHNISAGVSNEVLVQIHGGAYIFGDASWYGPEFLMDEDIVIVRINYRLGAFGFLTLESPELPGNQGLKDQVLALKWVQKNIKNFGGDPNSVTIIGESAGGASVYNHLISPLSKGLFHQAISESGTSYSAWGVSPPGYRKSTTEKLLTQLNCPANAKEGIPCISAKSPNDIISLSSNITKGLLPFGPVIEASGSDSFIVGLPNKWVNNPVPLIIGTVKAEGIVLTYPMTLKGYDFMTFSSNFNQTAPDFFGYSATASNPDEVTKAIREFYLKNEEITADDFANISQVAGDISFTVPITEGANRHTGPVYFYYFDFRIPVPGEDKRFAIGAPHAAESKYIWKGSEILTDPREIDLSQKLVKVVSRFMKNGIPIIEGKDAVEWKKWTSNNHTYLHIDLEGFHLKEGLAEDRINFWKSLNYMDKYVELEPSRSTTIMCSTFIYIYVSLSCGFLLLKNIK